MSDAQQNEHDATPQRDQQEKNDAGQVAATKPQPVDPATPQAPTCFTADDELQCPKEEVLAELEQLVTAYEQLAKVADHGAFGVGSGGHDRIAKALAVYREASGLMLAEVKPLYESFALRYTRDDPAYSDDTREVAIPLKNSAAESAYIKLGVLMKQINKAPAENTKNCLRTAQSEIDNIESRNPNFRSKILGEAITTAAACPDFDPSNEQVRAQSAELVRSLEAKRNEYLDKEMEAASGKRWEGNKGGAKNQGAGLKYLKADRDWGGKEGTTVLAVSVTGEWKVARRDIRGRPAQWGLPVHVAIVKDSTPDKLAQVFELTLITPGAEKRPQFDGFWVGRTWFIMKSAVPR